MSFNFVAAAAATPPPLLFNFRQKLEAGAAREILIEPSNSNLEASASRLNPPRYLGFNFYHAQFSSWHTTLSSQVGPS